MVGSSDAGHCTLAKMLDFESNRDAQLAGRPRVRKNRRLAGAKVAKTKGTLLVLGLLLTFGPIDRAIAQQQQQPNQVGQTQVQIVPQTPGYQAPKPYQVTPQTSQPTPMYPQSQSRRQSGR